MTTRLLLLISIFSLAAIFNQTHKRRHQMERNVVFFLKKLGLFQVSRTYFYAIEYNCVFIFLNITLN